MRLTALKKARSGVAAMEFAIVAPAMVTLIWGVYDISRALIAWEETCHAAEAVAQAAEKLSITNTQDKVSGGPLSALTQPQMQAAMSSIYTEMPWLNLGAGTGSLTGKYSVTLSGVAFAPVCPATNNNFCLPQTPTVLWSSYLTEGGGQLLQPSPLTPNSLYRLCGVLIPVAQFPNDATQLLYMINPNLVSGPSVVTNINLIPQVVADVQYVFTPTFPLLAGKTFTFWASASFPAPLGGDDQEIRFRSTAGSTAVENCPGGNSVDY